MSEDEVREVLDAADVVISPVTGEGADVLLVVGSSDRRVFVLDQDGVWVRVTDVTVRFDGTGGMLFVRARAWPLETVFWVLLFAWIAALAVGWHTAAVGVGVAALLVCVARVWRDRRR